MRMESHDLYNPIDIVMLKKDIHTRLQQIFNNMEFSKGEKDSNYDHEIWYV